MQTPIIPRKVNACQLWLVSTRLPFVTFSSWHKLLIASGDLKCFTVSRLSPYSPSSNEGMRPRLQASSSTSTSYLNVFSFKIYIIRRNCLQHYFFLSSIFVYFYFVVPNFTNNNCSTLWTYYLRCTTCAFHKEIAAFRAIYRMEYLSSALLRSWMVFSFSQHPSPPLNINIG